MVDDTRVYYELRETFYRVDSQGREFEETIRKTSNLCWPFIMAASETTANFAQLGVEQKVHYDMVSISVLRFDPCIDGIKTLFESHLFADDFAE